MRTLLAILLTSAAALASSPTDPASVLVVVQDNTGPETGTGGANAGQWVADHYMSARGIPAGNIVHISTFIENGAGASCVPGAANCDLTHTSSTNITYQSYLDDVRAPILAKLNASGGALAASIKYIVPTYGVPITIISKPVLGGGTKTGLSIDNQLAAMSMPSVFGWGDTCPYWQTGGNTATSTPPHINEVSYANPFYAVVRLDGPSAAIAAGLVDKAIAAETQGINIRSGTSYFDWQGLYANPYQVGATGNQEADATIYEARALCAARSGWVCTLNNQQSSGSLLSSAPRTLFYLGWYTLDTLDIWTFANGAVGSLNNSNSANSNSIRAGGSGSHVEVFLRRGATATWGVTNEPTVSGMVRGNIVLSHLWMGYTFGEAFYLGVQKLNFMAIAVGDPLYRPKFTGPSHIGRGVTLTGGASIH